MKTRFFRYMVSIKKKTQDNPSGVFQFVPLQDWSKPWTDAGLCQGPKYFSFNGISLYKLKESFLKTSKHPMKCIL